MKLLPCLILSLLFLSFTAYPQRKDFEFTSKALNEAQSIWVQLPENFDATTSYGVLYVLDADGHFEYMCRYVEYLSKPFAKVIPPLIVVGIRSKSPAYRYKNFTPTGANKPEQGNADQFVSFLTSELIPDINSKFKTNETRVLAGHSLAGLFALYTLWKKPDAFTHILAASPSLPYADGKLQSLFEQSKPTTTTKLFFSVAENDLNNYQRFTESFKTHLQSTDYKSWNYEFMAGMDHYSTCPLSFYKGLITVFK